MAETLLTLAQLNRIERDLDDQVSPAPATIRRLVNENRELRKSATDAEQRAHRYLAALGRIHATADEAMEGAEIR